METSEDIDSLETLCVAYNFLGLDDKGQRVADRILRTLHTFAVRRTGSAALDPSKVESYLDKEETAIFRSAIDLLLRATGHWPGKRKKDAD